MTKLSSISALAAATALSLAAISPLSAVAEEKPASLAETVASQLAETSAGKYEVEKTHAFLFWELSHGGLSTYTAKFTDWDASIDFNPENPASSSVTASINPASVQTDHPTKADEWHAELANDFFKVSEFPAITFTSTSAKTTGPNTGIVTGDLTFLGETKSVDLDVTYNGVANKPWLGELDIIGFDASTKITRSEFGLENALKYGIGDEVTIRISAEFVQAEDDNTTN